MTRQILTVVGARPQFIKAAALSRAIINNDSISEVLLHTGQHFDHNMSEIFFSELDIPKPAYNLDIHGGGHGQMTGRMLEGIEKVIQDVQPDAVLVYGDTNSTLAGALAASKLHLPVMHVEAGLRSFNRCMPEEINRVVADHLSVQLFCPTSAAVANLAAEGIKHGVHQVGDVMYDATIFARERAGNADAFLAESGLQANEFTLCTIHRAENTDDPERFAKVIEYISEIATRQTVVIVVHPRTRKKLDEAGLTSLGIKLIDPVGYLDMQKLLSNAKEIVTDSGGLQKEAYFHRVPCTTMRDETEWIETVNAGWNRLWTDDGYADRTDIPEYGSGHASAQIINLINAHFA